MSKADEKSKQYRDFRERCGIKDPVMLNEIEGAYYEGYHQAEKDLELSWEDIRDILKIYDDFTWKREWVDCKTLADGCQEILKRYKDLRNDTTSK